MIIVIMLGILMMLCSIIPIGLLLFFVFYTLNKDPCPQSIIIERERI